MRVTFTKKRDAKHFPNWVAHIGKRRIEGSHAGSDPRHLPVAAAATWLQRRTEVRPGRVGLVGGSKGAEMSLLAAAAFPDLIGPFRLNARRAHCRCCRAAKMARARRR